VSDRTIPAWSGDDIQLDCSVLPSGIYVIRISSSDNMWTGRMTVLR